MLGELPRAPIKQKDNTAPDMESPATAVVVQASSANVPLFACLIVKNEERVLERVLRSLRPFVDGYVIADTGSTDTTIEIANRPEFAGVNGVTSLVVSHPWVNFGHNRTEALRVASEHAPPNAWFLMIDADDVFDVNASEADAFRAEVTAASNSGHGGMHVQVSSSDCNVQYHRVQLFRNSSKWVFVGPMHEYARCEGTPTRICASKIARVISRREGARSAVPGKYLRDAEILRAEFPGDDPEGNEDLCTEPRTCFYLAQSFKDGGKPEAAARFYLRRVNGLGSVGYRDEVYVSLVRLIFLRQNDPDAQMEFCWRALEHTPHRLEAPHALLQSRRWCKRPHTARAFAIACVAVELSKNFRAGENPVPETGLFINRDVHLWKFAEEVAIIAWYRKARRLSLEAIEVALRRHNASKNVDDKRRMLATREMALALPD